MRIGPGIHLPRRAFPALLAVLVGAVLLPGLGVGPSVAQPVPEDAVVWTLPGDRGRLIGLPGDSALARALLEEIRLRPGLPGLPAEIPRGVEIVLAHDAESFSRAAGGLLPEWSAGVAIPSESRIVLPLFGGGNRNRGDLVRRVMRHEWAHIGLHQHLGGLRVPRWFSEGYAQWASGWDRGSAWRLRVLMAAGRTPPLDSLGLRFPEGSASAEVAYLLSATMVEYLVDVSGERGLEVLFRDWRATGRFPDALASTYGLTEGRLESAWKRWMRDRYGWLYILGSSGIGWGLLAALLFVLFRIRRRRDREGMARLRADEPPAAPAWWSEPGPPPDGDGSPTPDDGIFRGRTTVTWSPSTTRRDPPE